MHTYTNLFMMAYISK